MTVGILFLILISPIILFIFIYWIIIEIIIRNKSIDYVKKLSSNSLLYRVSSVLSGVSMIGLCLYATIYFFYYLITNWNIILW